MMHVTPFRHLIAMTDRFGTFEHADHASPRREHGYCVDDMARVLLIASREPSPTPVELELARRSVRFLADAQGATGRSRNRRSADGRWHGRRGVEDCWGRSVWALGTAAARTTGHPAASARAYFQHAAQQRSRWPRAMAFAALGAAALAEVDPREHRARQLLVDASDLLELHLASPAPGWGWPERRLSYANAVLPDALMTAGRALDRPELVQQGLALLGWLLDREMLDGHLSVTPAGGAGPDDARLRHDQQPIEVATMADACATALDLTGEARWRDGIRMAGSWFDGDNDLGAVMWDDTTGGAYDGLCADGPNRNQGAESTLALLSARQQVARLAPAA
jgi:hypothetical protein